MLLLLVLLELVGFFCFIEDELETDCCFSTLTRQKVKKTHSLQFTNNKMIKIAKKKKIGEKVNNLQIPI